jgi:hypothetical protein
MSVNSTARRSVWGGGAAGSAQEVPDRADEVPLVPGERRAIGPWKEHERRVVDQSRDLPVHLVIGPLARQNKRRHMDRGQQRTHVGVHRRTEQLGRNVGRDEVPLHLGEPAEEVAVGHERGRDLRHRGRGRPLGFPRSS